MELADRDQRDRAIEKLLRRSAGASAGTDAGTTCVDGETLAAWSSGALAQADALGVEEHLADCARCQAMLAAFAQTEPIAAAAPKWRGERFRWLVPFASAAAVLGIWMTMPQQNQAVRPATEARARLEAERLPPPVESVPVQPTAPIPLDQTAASRPQSVAPQPEADAGRERKDEAPATNARAVEQERALDRLARSEPPSAPAPPAVTPPPPRAEETIAAPRESQQLFAKAAAGEFSSPDGATRWRVLNGQVQRSTTAGESWDAVPLPSPATITAGHSPSPAVVWLVGRNGAIFVTTDGTTFQRVPFVSTADLSSVMAIDGRQATVATVEGRIYGTSDRGVTWIQP